MRVQNQIKSTCQLFICIYSTSNARLIWRGLFIELTDNKILSCTVVDQEKTPLTTSLTTSVWFTYNVAVYCAILYMQNWSSIWNTPNISERNQVEESESWIEDTSSKRLGPPGQMGNDSLRSRRLRTKSQPNCREGLDTGHRHKAGSCQQSEPGERSKSGLRNRRQSTHSLAFTVLQKACQALTWTRHRSWCDLWNSRLLLPSAPG